MMARIAFSRYIGIDYSGAEAPTSSLKGLRVFMAVGDEAPVEVPPPPSPRKYWTRKGIAEWIVTQVTDGPPAIIGIDHGFSFPLKYFEKYKLPHNWHAFLDDFCAHWPTDQDDTWVDFVRDGADGTGHERTGSPRWRRVTEELVGGKSVFHFDVQGQVAKSTHAGMPWLRYIRDHARASVHFWPFDGWAVPAAKSVLAEVYPRLWSSQFTVERRNSDQHDAYAVAAWLQSADRSGQLEQVLQPDLTEEVRAVATAEGWILASEGYERPARGAGKAGKRRDSSVVLRTSLAIPRAMPEISRFFGIAISMFYSEHGLPHFHARYGDYQASIDIESGLVRGELPPRALGLVLEWRAIHRAELLDAWQAAREHRALRPIAPLE